MVGNRKLVIEILGDTSGLEKSLKESGVAVESFGRKMAKFGKVAGVAIAGTAVVLGKKFADAAITAEEQTGKLNQAFVLQGKNAKAMAPFVERVEKANRKLGFTNSDTRDSLLKFVTAGESTAKASKDMALAADLARAKNIDLSQASLLLVRAHTGNTRALKGLGISIQPVTRNMTALIEAHKKSKTAITQHEKQLAKEKDAAATYALVSERLSKAVGGQAAEFSKSAAGGMAQFHAQLGNLEETLGAKLLPVIAKSMKFLNDLIGIFTGSGSASDKFKAALQRMGLSAKDARVIIGDLVGAVRLLRTVIVTAFNIMAPVVKAFFNVFKAELQFVDDLIHGRWAKLWGDAGRIFRAAFGALKAYLAAQIKVFGGLALRIGTAIKNGLISGLHGLGVAIANLVKRPINAIIEAINSLKIPAFHIHVGKKVLGRFVGVDFGVPAIDPIPGNIPQLARGAIVRSPTVAIVGERGPEAVIPLNRFAGVNIYGDISLPGVRDVDGFLRELQKRSGRTVRSRSGPFAGHILGAT